MVSTWLLAGTCSCQGWLSPCQPSWAAGGCRGISVVPFMTLVQAKLNNDPAKSFHFQCCVWSQPRATCWRNLVLPYF